MRAAVAMDLSDSAFDMNRLVWSAISAWCGGGEFYPVETKADVSLAKDLDMLAGIDGFQKRLDKGVMRGIASRIQWGEKDWSSFTIRLLRSSDKETELPKRLFALMHDGYLYPHITVQAYITQKRIGSLLSVAIAHTRELIPWAAQMHKTLGIVERMTPNNAKGVWERKSYDSDGSWSRFLVVDWNAYKATGRFIKQWHCTEQTILGQPMPQLLKWEEPA